MKFYDDMAKELEELSAHGRLRQLREIDGSSTMTEFEGRRMLNLSSNDYMGLAADKALRDEFYAKLTVCPDCQDFNLSASSSRLLTGNFHGYNRLEEKLSAMYGGRAACAFNSGYHANIGILPALSNSHDLILSDKLNHASIIDGIRLSEAKFKRYRHLDYEQLENMLEDLADDYRQIFIITESVFSMDGDIADLRRLVELKNKYNAILLVDEAHAVGVFGQKGCGVCEEVGVIEEIDVIVGTFGKALASAGAFAITSELVKQYLVNRMRSLIFTTGLPPVVVNWTSFVLDKIEAMSDKRRYLRELWTEFRNELVSRGISTCGESQIVPILLGEDTAAVEAAMTMREAGFLLFPIRPPTVPPNTARLRLSLTAAMKPEDLRGVLDNL